MGQKNHLIKYLLVKSSIDLDYEFLSDFFKGLLGHSISIEGHDSYLKIIHSYTDELNIAEAINSLNNDLALNICVFSSKQFGAIDELEENCKVIIPYFLEVEASINFLEEKNLIKAALPFERNKELLSLALGKYTKDSQMIEIIRGFFRNNLNTSASAHYLYLHRNTLINKLDKFHEYTGFDIRKFEDAVIIYQLLNN